MTQFESIIDYLQRRANEIGDNVIEPSHVLAETEQVVSGEFPEQLKRYFTLRLVLGRESKALAEKASALIEQIEEMPDGTLEEQRAKLNHPLQEQFRDLSEELNHAARISATLESAFWGDVHAAFPSLCGHNKVGVAKGWVAWWCDEMDSGNLRLVIDGILR